MGRRDMPQYRLKHSPMEMVYSLFSCGRRTSNRRFPREAAGEYLRRPFFGFLFFGADVQVRVVNLPDNVSKMMINLSRSAISTRSLSMLFSRFMFSSTPLIARKR
jgi:hypothetical protein